jgi:hypothetical protein
MTQVLDVRHNSQMKTQEPSRPGKTFENILLLVVGLVALAPLYYQLPRWANGLSPTFVHPNWIEQSPFPIVLYMAKIHPVVWIAITVLCFMRLCYNFGWNLKR